MSCLPDDVIGWFGQGSFARTGQSRLLFPLRTLNIEYVSKIGFAWIEKKLVGNQKKIQKVVCRKGSWRCRFKIRRKAYFHEEV